MSKRKKIDRAERRVIATGARRRDIDVEKLARVLIEIARAEEAAERAALQNRPSSAARVEGGAA